MTPENFCYWLQGYFEISRNEGLTPVQAQIIKDHLQLVFMKETPSRSPFEVLPIDLRTKTVVSC